MPSFEQQLDLGLEKKANKVEANKTEAEMSVEEKIKSRLDDYLKERNSNEEFNIGEFYREKLKDLDKQEAPIGDFYEIISKVIELLEEKKVKYKTERIVFAANEWLNRKTHIEHTLPAGDRN